MSADQLTLLLEDNSFCKEYERAISALKSIGLYNALLEKVVLRADSPEHPQGTEIAAAAHYESLGYIRCLEDLFNLKASKSEETYTPVPDFGATERMIASGEITEEEAAELNEDK